MVEKRSQRAPAAKLAPLWERLEGQIAWYDKKAAASQRAYKVTKATIIVLALAIPVIAEYAHFESFERAPAFLVAICAGGILLLEGLLHINKWHENWILYRSTCEGLRNEQHLFFEKAGPYAKLKPAEAQQALAERTGALVMAEHSKWVHDRNEKAETTTGG